MSVKKISEDNEDIDLLELAITIWKNKLKIFIIMLLFIISATIASYKQINQKPYYTATTEIRQISTFDEFRYETFNFYLDRIKTEKSKVLLDTENNNQHNNNTIKLPTVVFSKKITSSYLLNLFVDKLDEGRIFRDAIKKFNLIDKNNYTDNQLYENNVTKLASSIKLLPPSKDAKGYNLNKWQIQFHTENKEGWQNIIRYIEKPINEEIRLYLKEVLEEFVSNEKKLKNHRIDDLDLKILSAIEVYDRKTLSRVAFLKEQAQIARKLGIKKNSLIESPTFDTDVGIITNIRIESPYYTRGYDMIEKEIELIQNREDKTLFIEELQNLEKAKEDLIKNKDIERFQNLINDTPIFNPSEFNAANISHLTTSFQTKKKESIIKPIFLAGLIGLILGIFYVLIESSIKLRLKNISS